MFLILLTSSNFTVLQASILLAWNTTRYSGGGAATYKESDNALGLNLGAGSCMKLTDQFDLYLEAKYIVSKYGQFILNAGILINIDWLKKHEYRDKLMIPDI